jgi:hypothetical protein
LAQVRNELGGLPESVEIQQWELGVRLLWRSGVTVVGPAQGNGSPGAVRETENDIRSRTPAEAEDFTPLPAQRVMGMDNRDESQRGLG